MTLNQFRIIFYLFSKRSATVCFYKPIKSVICDDLTK